MSEARTPADRAAFAEGGAALARLARYLSDVATLEELERAFRPRVGPLAASPMAQFLVMLEATAAD
jgi:hypothetical protein